MFIEIVKFLIYSLLIVAISKYALVRLLRKLAEALNLSAKAVGNIAGVATSVPELLTISFSAFAGLAATSVFNIISSNIINLVQYSFAIILNKNHKILRNKAIRIQLLLVLLTILIPILMLIFNIEFELYVVPVFLILFILFYNINLNIHKMYLKKSYEESYEKIEEEKRWVKGKRALIIKYSIYLVITSVALYLLGDRLSIVLENMSMKFNIPEIIIGIALGFTTSLPELITFFESQRHYKKSKTKENEEGVVEATNNLLTSNVLNLFIIQSIGIIIINLV